MVFELHYIDLYTVMYSTVLYLVGFRLKISFSDLSILCTGKSIRTYDTKVGVFFKFCHSILALWFFLYSLKSDYMSIVCWNKRSKRKTISWHLHRLMAGCLLCKHITHRNCALKLIEIRIWASWCAFYFDHMNCVFIEQNLFFFLGFIENVIWLVLVFKVLL